MIIALQPHIMEHSVFAAVRRDPLIEPHYQRSFARCYEEREPDRRERAFQELHETWFCQLGLKERILGVAREFEHLVAHVNRLAVTHAPSPRAHVVELFGAPGRYTVAMAVTPALLLDPDGFVYWARHEFMHVDDMLDPAFGFVKDDWPVGSNRAAKNLFQDRYAVLWAMSIDARLARRGQLPDGVRERRKGEFVRAFALQQAEPGTGLFDLHWEKWGESRPDHADIADSAGPGSQELRALERQAGAEAPRMAGGGTCSLCGFSTFGWGSPEDASDIAAAVTADFPGWLPEHGVCGRCVEVYRAGAGRQGGADLKLGGLDCAVSEGVVH